MSIEETYKGMWSSDPSLLKSLLDAGNTILHLDGTRSVLIRVRKREDHDSYEIETDLGDWRTYHIGMSAVLSFLVPPRPLVLEPKPLRWCMWDAFSSNLKARDEWRTSEGLLASGKVRYTVESRDARFYWRVSNEGEYTIHAHGYCDTQEDAINKIEKWRKDHLEMPVFKCESEPMVEPKPLEWGHAYENEFGTEEIMSVNGDWAFCAWEGGGWMVSLDGTCVHDGESGSELNNGDFDTAKAAIQEWRVNHLKSMLP